MSAASVLDAMTETEAREALTRCCGSSRWVAGMLSRRPFGDDDALERSADEAWATATPDDVREALSHHPEIGADLDELRRRFASTATWSSGEQSGMSTASDETLRALRDGNRRYRERYGFTFVVCATGKSADEMLALLREREHNAPEHELSVAAAEQGKITKIRLRKLSP